VIKIPDSSNRNANIPGKTMTKTMVDIKYDQYESIQLAILLKKKKS
jgi:hypothetical protein